MAVHSVSVAQQRSGLRLVHPEVSRILPMMKKHDQESLCIGASIEGDE
jgi:hypothetical protein